MSMGKGVVVSFVKEGLVPRCRQKCKKSRDTILKFSLSMMQGNLTRCQKHIWTLERQQRQWWNWSME